jgi:hypothetical protein
MGNNWQVGMVIFGAEWDIQWSGQQQNISSVVCTPGCTATEAVGAVAVRDNIDDLEVDSCHHISPWQAGLRENRAVRGCAARPPNSSPIVLTAHYRRQASAF